MSGPYVIQGGHRGRERLRVLSSVLGASTADLLARVGVPDDARCLDVGCGGGDVTRLLARLASRGAAEGVDMDATAIELARTETTEAGITNALFRVADVSDDDAVGGTGGSGGGVGDYDVVYARFLLCHVANPGTVLQHMVKLCRPGGVVVVEDTDIVGSLCWPPSEAFTRCCALYSETVRARGGEPDIGRRLPTMLHGIGLDGVTASVSQPGGLNGDAKTVQLLTLNNIAETAIALGLTTADEVNRLRTELTTLIERPDTYITTARIIQAWGRTPLVG